MAIPARRPRVGYGSPTRGTSGFHIVSAPAPSTQTDSILSRDYRTMPDRPGSQDISLTTRAYAWLDRLGRRYDGMDQQLLSVLIAQPTVGPLLMAIAERVPHYFPEEDTQLAIRAVSDPEDGSVGWYVVITTSLPPRTVGVRLDQFDTEWWLKAKASIVPDFVVTVELA